MQGPKSPGERSRRLSGWWMKTTQLPTQSLSPEHSTSGDGNNSAYIEPLALSWRTEEQYPNLFLFVIFLLLHFLVIYIRKIVFTSLGRIQHRAVDVLMYFGVHFKPRLPEILGLIMMAWKTIQRLLLPLDTTLPTLWTCKKRLSLRKCLHPKGIIVWGLL